MFIFLRKSDCLGCAVLLCFVVCLTLLASFFPSFSSLIKTCIYSVWCLMSGVFGDFIIFSFILN